MDTAGFTLTDDGTLDTVVEAYCRHCHKATEHRVSLESACDYRDKDTGEIIRFDCFCNDMFEVDECLMCGN